MKTDHYEALCRQWAQKTTTMDPVALARIPGVSLERGVLLLHHFGTLYRVDLSTGQIRSAKDGSVPNVTRRLNIYTLFGYAKPQARLTGQWVSFRQLQGTAPFDAAFHRGILTPLARTFAGRQELLRCAMDAIGAQPLPHSDCGGQLEAFACIPLRVLFWDRDADFDASANLLFDASATDFIHPESIVSIGAAALHSLTELAGLEPDPASM